MRKWLVALAVLLGAGAVMRKVLGTRAAEFQGLTESEVREKLERQLPSQIPEDKRTVVADRVVARMRDTGALAEEEEEEGEEEAPSRAADAEGSADEAQPDPSTAEAEGSEEEDRH